MNVKGEVDIKDELVESSEVIRTSGYNFEQDSELEEIQEKNVCQNIYIKEELDVEDEEVDSKKGCTEASQHIDQTSRFDSYEKKRKPTTTISSFDDYLEEYLVGTALEIEMKNVELENKIRYENRERNEEGRRIKSNIKTHKESGKREGKKMKIDDVQKVFFNLRFLFYEEANLVFIMDIKSEVEIKDELIESPEDFINNAQRFEQVSVFEGIQQENLFYPSVDVKKEIELKADPLYIKEENTESGYHVDQISGLDDSQV
ncbi:hypothetical protein Anas_11376 [Armadillidium nasatum]|uniref:Uncharacterized protein n=1 Tax=Armadillidium nasatum TaxID=96803 RepID=A0A5N5TJC2_9CRUS|nr:hypothetical protein Anas_11376 [Armadillidium nasatum]